MNKKQYNNVIDYTLKHEQTDDSLSTARAIFNNMGVALPQGDIKRVYNTIKTGKYMGWRACGVKQAQTAANNGVAAIGINENTIIVLSANDEEQPVAQTASVMSLDENTSAFAVSDLEYYSYSYGATGQGGSGTCLNNRYKREDAVAYAREYAYSTGPNYVNFGDPIFTALYFAQYGVNTGTADCANFVSQCLVAGGLKMNDDWYFNQHINTAVALPGITNIYYRDKNGLLVSYPISYYFSATWTKANSQYEYFSNTANGYTSTNVVKINSVYEISHALSHYNINPGDLMYFSRDGGKTVYHATIISDVTNNDIRFCAHTDGRKDQKLSEKIGNESVIIVRLNDCI